MTLPRTVDGMQWVEFDRQCREIVRGMARVVRREMPTATARTKADYAGVAGEDIVTTADLRAQEYFVRSAMKRLPYRIGFIGEENGLRKGSTLPVPINVTIDPLDGTRRFSEAMDAKRSLVPGEASSMLGVLVGDRPVASYICDVATLETYTRPPVGVRILRALEGKEPIDVATIPGFAPSLERGTLLRHGKRPVQNPTTRRLCLGAFGRVIPGYASIGLSAVRVLTGELAGLLRIGGGFSTPWDDAPIMAMCGQGDLVPFRVGRGDLERIKSLSLLKVTPRSYDLLYVHRRYVPQLMKRMTEICSKP